MLEAKDIAEARKRIQPHIEASPIIHSNHLSERFGLNIYLKLENLQDTGSFKIRGAINHLLRLPSNKKKQGVVAASAGNHAQGVACAARQLGVSAIIFMPKTAPIGKLLATRYYGARVIQEGDNYDEAAQAATRYIQKRGGSLIPAFDDPDIIAGQGTIGLEILQVLPEVDTVIVPVGGGGLIAGISLALKGASPAIEIIGVQAGYVPAVVRSLEEGERTCVASRSTLADGIAVAAPGELPFAIIQRLVDKVQAVSEESIESAVMTFLERKNLVVEGAGATPLALLQEGKTHIRGQNVVLVVSGGNLDIQWLDRIIQRGALMLDRRMQLSVVVRDIPGSLSQIAGLIAESGANILQVYHHRWAPEYPVNVSRVDFHLEIQDRDHAQSLLGRLREEGVEIVK